MTMKMLPSSSARTSVLSWRRRLLAFVLSPLLAASALLTPVHSQTSAVPGFISYQGKVSNANGTLVGVGTPVNRKVIFRIWSHQSNSTLSDLVYSEEQTVTIADGEFSVLIGQGGPVTTSPLGYAENTKGPSTVTIGSLGVFGAATRYLGVTIDDGSNNADPEISPRQQLVTSAYAFRAKFAEALGSNGNSTITVTDTGNVGIGNAAPALPLSFASQLGDKISLYGNFNFGLGIQANNVQLKGHSSSDDITFGYGPSASMIETMRIKGNGNVGIGTNNPTAKLDVNGVLNVFDGGKNYPAGISTELGSQLVNFGINDGRFGTQTTAQPGGFLRLDARGLNTPVFQFLTRAANAATASTAMVIDGTGNVGIGTSTPVAPLSFGNVVGQKISFWNNSSTAIYGIGLQGGLLQIHADAAGGDVAFGYGASAAFTETMRIKGNGNVGIGISTPGAAGSSWAVARLAVNGNIALRGDGTGANSWFNQRLLFGGDATGYLLQFASVRNDGTLNPTIMSLSDLGRVGIGTTGPIAKLHVSSSTASAGDNTAVFTAAGINAGGFSSHVHNGVNGDIYWRSAAAAGKVVLQDTGGRVGIGTASPGATLHVNGLGVISGNLSYYVDGFGHGGPWGSNPWTSGGISIIASNGISAAGGFFVVSDARLKQVVGESKGATDLLTLSKIKITDFKYRDRVEHGNRTHKMVIAQQVEEVYPQAVTRRTDVVPDIFKTAAITDGWIKLATDLKQGERVRLIDEAGKSDLHEVEEAQADGFRTKSQPSGAKLFVYGREVADFRSVDYDAIAMLNVSATQEIKREKDAEIAVLRAANAALERRLAEVESKDRARDAKLAAIEKLLSASSTVMAQPAKSATANGQE